MAEITGGRYTGARPSALGFRCPACGAEQAGDPQQGCQSCGAGKPGRRVGPVPMPGDAVEAYDPEPDVLGYAPPPPPPTRLRPSGPQPGPQPVPKPITFSVEGEGDDTAAPVTLDAPVHGLREPASLLPPASDVTYAMTVATGADGTVVTLRDGDGVVGRATDETVQLAFVLAYEALEDARRAADVDALAATLRDSAPLVVAALTSHIDLYERTPVAIDHQVPEAYALRDRLQSLGLA